MIEKSAAITSSCVCNVLQFYNFNDAVQAVVGSGCRYTTMMLYIRWSKIIFGVLEMDLDRQSNRTFHSTLKISLGRLRNLHF